MIFIKPVPIHSFLMMPHRYVTSNATAQYKANPFKENTSSIYIENTLPNLQPCMLDQVVI